MRNRGILKKCTGIICSVIFVAMVMCPTGLLGAEEKDAGTTKLTLSELRAQRKKLAQRKRRIIFNNDGDDIGGLSGLYPERTKEVRRMASTPQGLLKMRTTDLLGSQVDSIFYHSALGLKLYHGGGPYEELYGDRCNAITQLQL